MVRPGGRELVNNVSLIRISMPHGNLTLFSVLHSQFLLVPTIDNVLQIQSLPILTDVFFLLQLLPCALCNPLRFPRRPLGPAGCLVLRPMLVHYTLITFITVITNTTIPSTPSAQYGYTRRNDKGRETEGVFQSTPQQLEEYSRRRRSAFHLLVFLLPSHTALRVSGCSQLPWLLTPCTRSHTFISSDLKSMNYHHIYIKRMDRACRVARAGRVRHCYGG